MNENNEITKSNNNKILIVIIIVLSILLLGLTYYTFFVRDTNKIQDNSKQNNNNKQNNNEIDDKNDNLPKIYSTFLTDTKELDKLVIDFPYEKINESVSHNQLWKVYTLLNKINDVVTTKIGYCENSIIHRDDVKDSNGVTYPKYEEGTPEYMAKDFGLTVEEISKIDKNVWTAGGQYCFTSYDMNDLKNKHINIYNEMFNQSFTASTTILDSFSSGWTYDKNVNVLMFQSSGGIPCNNKNGERLIINTNKKENSYEIEFVSAIFIQPMCSGDEKNYKLELKDETIDIPTSKINSTKDRENFIKQYQDKLTHYVITFKMVDGYYQYDNIIIK